jgi:hypothetical protein
MKKLIIAASMIAFASLCSAQVTNPPVKMDTAKVDSIQVEKINKMPMDSTHLKTTPSHTPDSTMHRRMGDDEDPKRNVPK